MEKVKEGSLEKESPKEKENPKEKESPKEKNSIILSTFIKYIYYGMEMDKR